MNVSNRPSWGTYAELPEHGLAFYLNGAIGNMSSYQDQFDGTTPQTLQGMVVLDLQNHKASFIPELNQSILFITLRSQFPGQ